MAKFKLIAHRGYTEHYPENTIVGLNAAIEAGARAIEIDVQLTSDQEPVLFHDRSLKRVCGVDGAVHGLTLKQVEALQASEPGRLGDSFSDTNIATLKEFVQLMKQHPDVQIFVEIKRVGIEHFGNDKILTILHRVLAPLQEQCVLISFGLEFVLAAQRNGWEKVGVILDHWSDRDLPIVKVINPQYIFCDYKDLPKLGSVNKGNVQLACYEITDPDLAIKVASRGADYIETFDIEKMTQLLAEHLD